MLQKVEKIAVPDFSLTRVYGYYAVDMNGELGFTD